MVAFVPSAPLLSLLLASAPNLTAITKRVSLLVCTSPGCVADGADATLAKLVALAPPGVVVVEGACASGCGAGPIVVEEQEPKAREQQGPKKGKHASVVHRRVTPAGDALIELLLGGAEEGNTAAVDPNLVRGYDLVQEALTVSSAKDFDVAVPLFVEGIDLARGPAVELQAARDVDGGANDQAGGDGDVVEKKPPRGLEWLVAAYRGEAEARLAIGDADGAAAAAANACDMAGGADASSFECVAEVCAARGDAAGEIAALRALFELEPQSTAAGLPRDVANRRRTLGFRLAKLEREAA